MARGRPTKLTESVLTQAQDYLDSTSSFLPGALLPTVEGLALALKVHRDSIYEWASPYELPKNPSPAQRRMARLRRQFSDIFEELKAGQAEKLIQKSLAGHYNATIAKMILSGKHGYVEKSSQDITSGGEQLKTTLVEFVTSPPGDTGSTNPNSQ